ncbi:MAG: hypothetical protein K2X48_09690 [Chitinophagaceae bacterium]|nr:hypothetical protein [Chitinophagaceae bacterium]
MKAEVEKNLQFTRHIKAEGRLREFNFTRHTGLREGLFTVDVVDDRSNRLIFEMKRINNTWMITQTSLPQWVLSCNTLLHEAIETELKNNNLSKPVTENAA